MQSTFAAAIEKRTRFDSSLPLLPWLCGILVRLALQERRAVARKPVEPLNGVELEAGGPGPVEEVLAIECATVVALGVSSLGPPYREVLSLRLQGLTTAQIARALGRSHSTVRTQLGRGLKRLRSFLSSSG